MNIATVDLLLLLVLLISVVIGAWRGLLYEVLSVIGWVAAFVLAQWWAVAVGEWLPLGEAAEPLRYAAGFALVFVAVAFAAGLLAWLVKKLVESVGLRPVDRTLGALRVCADKLRRRRVHAQRRGRIGIGFLARDAPVFQLVDQHRAPGDRAGDEGPRRQDLEIGIEIADLGLTAAAAFETVHHSSPAPSVLKLQYSAPFGI